MVLIWNNRYLVHGRVSFTTEEVELTALLGSSPALVEASVRLLVADAKVKEAEARWLKTSEKKRETGGGGMK